MYMFVKQKVLRLIRALVLWAVITTLFTVVLRAATTLSGLTCGIEWVMLCVIGIMHLLAPVLGPLLLGLDQKDGNT
jgi:hypothetical protein